MMILKTTCKQCKKEVTIKIDETAQIEVEGKEKVLSKLTYQTEDKKIATVDKNGTKMPHSSTAKSTGIHL